MKTKSYGLQNETRQYLRRLYSYGRELQGADIADLDDFVKGLKQLGLWGNTVCWPMRSIHNVGTGSTVLSLGGIGKFDGTMVNSPTWNLNGVSFTGNEQSITTTIDINNYKGPAAMFASIRPISCPAYGIILGQYDGGSLSKSFFMRKNGATNAETYRMYSGSNIAMYAPQSWVDNTPVTLSYTQLNLTGYMWADDTSANTSTATGTPLSGPSTVSMRMGYGFLGIHSFGCFMCSQIPLATMALLRGLYKTTIGKNLGLL